MAGGGSVVKQLQVMGEGISGGGGMVCGMGIVGVIKSGEVHSGIGRIAWYGYGYFFGHYIGIWSSG